MTVADQEQIANSIMRQTRGTSLDAVMDEGLERVRAGWQDLGYFKVQVTGDTRTLTSSPTTQRIALSVHVDGGSQYKLSSITFKNNKVISSADILRGFFPIANGEIFSREKIGKGLENLRKAYGELGYINFTSVPDTQFDDENRLITLDIDLDEGKQFRVGRVNVLGLDESARQEVLNALPIKPGQIYNSRLWEAALLKNASMLPDCECPDREQLREDNKSGVVTLTLDFRPCSRN